MMSTLMFSDSSTQAHMGIHKEETLIKITSRLYYCLVTPNLIEKISNMEHKFTSASDHASIIIEIDTENKIGGKGTFRAPPIFKMNLNISNWHKKL